MILVEALGPLLPAGSGVVAFVGAGGKTTAMLRLARELEEMGRSVLVTTTTHLSDPRREPEGPAGRLVFRPEMESPRTAGAGFTEGTGVDVAPGITMLVSREASEPGKVKGIHPSWVPSLRRSWDFVLVEADGSRRLPLKAPGNDEPVLPPGTDLVVGVLGLDGLGKPMNVRTVHRPDCFSRVTACEPGSTVSWEHLVSLVRHPDGLFKGAPAARALLLNKVDAAPFHPSRVQLAGLGVERVLVCQLDSEPSVSLFRREVQASCR
ncbi:MAG: putative selenium-dependent hydroxylase accessory protein YqeC [Holophagales bacterium]|nr:putative selenium-dependent hydroxylase accessory protein YqeC [Holophagales bacterium]MBK9969044.1 putative selenium-dependent hydroxylase accessory protein YqeC [Holophagales bacterium]